MSTTGLEVFDRTIQTTNIWLDEIMESIGPDRQLAWRILSTVTRKIRDCLPAGLAAHLSVQLPLLVRGAYYEHYQPGHDQIRPESGQAFLDEIAAQLSDVRPINPANAFATVVAVLERHVTGGEMDKVWQSLPKVVRGLWP